MTSNTASLPTAATSPDGSPSPPGRHHSATAVALIVSAQFVVMFDTSIVNVALPTIQASLGFGPTSLSWVVNAYVVTFAGLLLVLGRVADLIGRRRMFVAGSAVFAVGSVVAASSGDAWMLLAGRVIQGVGAAALSPAAMSLLLIAFPGDRRARAMGLWGAASTAGGAMGVVTGGLLAESVGWEGVFWITVPISAAAVLLGGPLLLDPPRGPRRSFDAAGAVSLTALVLVLVHTALRGGSGQGGVLSWAASIGAVIALASAVVVVERRASDPLLPLALFESRVFSTGVVLALLGGAVRASTFVLIALYLQAELMLSPTRGGLAMAPTSLAGFLISLRLLPLVLRALGSRRTLVLGLSILAGGQLWLLLVGAEHGYTLGVLPGLLLVAAGVALSFTPTTMVVASAAPASHAGLVAGLVGSATQVGAAVGTATFTAVALGTDGGYGMAFGLSAAVALVTAGGAINWRRATGPVARA